jgi:5S rRNA maturation endonuclease (ribonuclease M5)
MSDKNEFWKKYKETVLSRLTYQEIYGQIKNQKEGTDGWVTGLCPFHSDKHNSFAFNRKTLVYACFAGCGKGSAIDFIMHTSGRSFKDTLLELGERLNIPRPFQNQAKRPPIKEELVKRWAGSLNEEVRRYLREKRGLSDDIIKKYQIGWDVKRQRNTIPIRDERGNLVNIRLYNAKKDPKIINFTEGHFKYGSPARLYGLGELIKCKEEKQVIICEGEFDRLLLRQEGLMAVTSTHGCSVFRIEWIPYFKDKNVVIIYDCDKEGQAAANTIILKAFKNSEISSIKNIVLPLKGDKDDKDITDYFHKRGFSGIDLQRMIDDTPVHKYEEVEEKEETVNLESFTVIEQKKLVDKKVQCEITVCGETSEAFHAVEQFKVTFCPKLKKGECFDCIEPITVPRGSQEYIGSCMSTNVQLVAMLRSFCCRYGQKPTIEILQRITIKEFFCHQKVHRITHASDENGNVIQFIDGKKQELIEKKVYYLSSENVKPGNYLATGYIKTHPKTQQVTLLIESLTPEEDDYQTFDLEKNITHLKAFQKLSWAEILQDLADNVTKVYERDEILTALLLTFCSPLWIMFNEEMIRGWLISTIIGDSGSGKTQSHTRLSEFVDIGDCFSGLTGTRTGLAYALVEHHQKGWQVRIGRYPANSRKILAVDETQHLPDWDLRAISKAMEEGFLQIDRVKSKGYECMTRLIMICNPKKDRVMDTYSFGCESLKGLYPPTIIRRIDLAVFANTGDFQKLSFINKKKAKHTQRKITPEMLRAVIYWSWNLKPNQVVFTSDAEDLCLKEAERVSLVFGYAVDVPLVPPSDFRNILARISAAFAVVLLSADDKFSQLIIKPKHVKMAIEFLTRVYSYDNCSLDDYSEIKRAGSQLTDYEDIEKAFIEKKQNEKHDYQNEIIFPKCIYILRINDSVKREDLAEQAGCGLDAVRKIIKLLKKFNLIDSTKNGYTKKPKFNKFLRRFLKSNTDFFQA